VRLKHLFPSGLKPGVRRVRHGHDQFVLARFERRRDIKCERIVTARVLADLLAIDRCT
jgi:hypothetical protein